MTTAPCSRDLAPRRGPCSKRSARARRLALVVAAAALCAPPPVTAAAAPEVDGALFNPEDLTRLRQADAVAISPDGRSVAYGLEVPRTPFADPDGPAWVELHVIGADGVSRPYVTGEVKVGDIAWTPDGAAVSFVAQRGEDEHSGLYVIPLAGGEARRAIAHGASIAGYSWSGDGRRVAFVAEDPAPPDAARLEQAGFVAEVVDEDWSPQRVWIAEVSGGTAESAPTAPLPLDGHAVEVSWCPGGDRLAVTVAPRALVDDEYMFSRLRIVDPASGAVVGRVENPGKIEDVVWSPDCRHLAFVSGADLHDPSPGRLMVAAVADGSFRDLVPGYLGEVRDIAWLDAESLVFLGDEGVETLVYRIGRDGGGKTVLTGPSEVVWSDLSVAEGGSGTGTVVLTGQSARHPDEVFRGTLAAGRLAPERLTDSNPWLADKRFADQEVVRYRARDGLELEGILIRPLERAGDARVPLLVVVHGGPEAHVRDGWSTTYSRPGQIAAARGYAVFLPNYRGSTGRGVEFSLTSQGRPAQEEFDDIVDGVDQMIDSGLVDRDRVGITGGSYGGYAAAWGATYYSDRFAAAVMMVGISNKLSKIGTSDIPEELYLVHARKRIWEDWQHFLEASPIYYTDRARTPILILHGKEDPRVHPAQSLELYRALEIRDQAPVRLVYYPGEKHGNRKAAARYDYSLRMLRWFDHYLRGPGGEPPPPTLDYPLDPGPTAPGGD